MAPSFRFDTEAEALQSANNTEFGLASWFYSKDIDRIFRVAKGLEYGTVGTSTGRLSTVVASFGGIKQSGNGREGWRYGIDEYIETKYLCMGGINL